MDRIDLTKFAEGVIEVDATAIAADLGLEPGQLLDLLRAGQLTARCEQGIAEDAGRLRLTFFHGEAQLQLLVDEQGQILQRSVQRLRKPGTAI